MAGPQVVVELGMAVICFMGSCHPALVGTETPVGTFQLKQYTTSAKGYGGDLLVFKENENYVWAIHRVLNVGNQQRKMRLKLGDANQRVNVTLGCINIDNRVYSLLIDCCSDSELIIKR